MVFSCFSLAYSVSQACCILKKRVMLGYITVLPQQLTKNMHLYLPVHRNNHPHAGTGNSEHTTKAGNGKKKAEKEKRGIKYQFYQGIWFFLCFLFLEEENSLPCSSPRFFGKFVSLDRIWSNRATFYKNRAIKTGRTAGKSGFSKNTCGSLDKTSYTGSWNSGEKKEHLQLKELP